MSAAEDAAFITDGGGGGKEGGRERNSSSRNNGENCDILASSTFVGSYYIALSQVAVKTTTAGNGKKVPVVQMAETVTGGVSEEATAATKTGLGALLLGLRSNTSLRRLHLTIRPSDNYLHHGMTSSSVVEIPGRPLGTNMDGLVKDPTHGGDSDGGHMDDGGRGAGGTGGSRGEWADLLGVALLHHPHDLGGNKNTEVELGFEATSIDDYFAQEQQPQRTSNQSLDSFPDYFPLDDDNGSDDGVDLDDDFRGLHTSSGDAKDGGGSRRRIRGGGDGGLKELVVRGDAILILNCAHALLGEALRDARE